MSASRLRWLGGLMRLALWLVVAAWVLFGIGLGVLHGWIVPRIEEFRPRLELEASKAVGVPVRIGAIRAESVGMIPTFELSDVTFLDAQGREALRLPRLLGAVSPASLLGLGFEQIHLDRPELDIRRGADGKIHVGGLDVSEDADSGRSAAADWLLSQNELVIRGGTVRWTDELKKAPTLALTGVDGVARNGRKRHLLRLDATPPAEWGDRFSVRGIFRQSLLNTRASDFSGWSGQIFGDFQRLDFSQARPYANMETLGVDLSRGTGALRAWIDVAHGQWVGGTADVALRDVDALMGVRLQPLAFDFVAGRVGGGQRADGFDFNTEALSFRTRDGLQWPGGNVQLSHTEAQGSVAARTELKADRLDLAALAQIADRLPLDAQTRTWIASFAPAGLVESIDARWQGALQAPISYTAKGRVSGLSLAALPAPAGPATVASPVTGRPGLSGASMDFDVTQQGGQARISMASGKLELPGIFEDPVIAMERLSVNAQWKRANGKTEVQLRDLKFANADAQGEAQVSWSSSGAAAGPDAMGVLDLQGSLSRGAGDRVHRYLPLVMADTVRHYVRDAVSQGDLSDVKFRVKGPVDQIPFSNPQQGEFKVSAKIRNGQLAYVPRAIQPAGAAPWPALSDLQGELVFQRAALNINGVTGKVVGLPGLQLVKADARIPDLMRNATVEVNADIKGPLAEAFGFVNTSPLAGLTGEVLAQATGTGTGDYRFKLTLPINNIDSTQVEGTVKLPGNDVQFSDAFPPLQRLKASIAITEKGFSVAGAQARLLGGDVRIDGGMRAPPLPLRPGVAATPTLSFRAQGTATADGLRQAPDLGALSRMARSATGSTPYTATLAFRRGRPEVMVSSTLQGLALDLPAPLGKTAEAALPLRFESALVPASMAAGQALQDQVSVTLGRVAAVNYIRTLGTDEPRVARGSIGVGLEAGESVPMPEAGVAASVNLARVDLDVWQKLLAEPVAATPTTGTTTGSTAATTAAVNRVAAGPALGYLPTTMAIRAKELVVEGRTLNNVVVGGSREGLTWRANVDASELNGYLEYRQPGGIGAGRLYARLSRLSLAPTTASDVEALLNEQPTSIPALDIVVEDLELRGKKLGRVEIDAVNRGASSAARDGVREWRLNKFNIILPEAVLTATGNWVAINAQIPTTAVRGARSPADRRRTVMSFRLEVADSGELLKRFGMADVIRRGKGQLEGQIAWIGSPLNLDYPTLNGQFNVNMESGQFVKAEPGIAKLLGVLSLQSLPRRLTLDFRDVFSEGFAFDFVRGDVSIQQGLAYTNNLQMRGVNAAVLMEGSADIAKETQSLKVVVVPEINAGTASLIATAINPAIGLGSFLAQMFLRRPLMQAATQEFQVDGTWSDPRVTKVERTAASDKTDSPSGETR
ncbi:YhdP family protein [Polaromonas sp. YR568]|uniref:YhdP family protein n=1 Tax=Polaromonas sp. YR568 TaxID=1855301 RepID=UPI003137E8D0